MLPEYIHHLHHDRRLTIDQVVRQQHRERLVLHHRSCAQHRVSQAQRLDLADIDAVDVGGGDFAHDAQQLVLAAHRQLGFQLIRLVEMILDRALVASGDEHHVGDARRHRLFHRILDQRLVHDGHHLLRADLGGRQKAAAHAGNGEHCFGDSFHISEPFCAAFPNVFFTLSIFVLAVCISTSANFISSSSRGNSDFSTQFCTSTKSASPELPSTPETSPDISLILCLHHLPNIPAGQLQ